MVSSTKLETTESTSSPVALPSGVLKSMNRQAGSFFIVRFFVTAATTSVLNGAGVGVRLHHHRRPLLTALTGGVRKTDKNDVAPFHGFSGRSSYSSQSSCLTLSQARA